MLTALNRLVRDFEGSPNSGISVRPPSGLVPVVPGAIASFLFRASSSTTPISNFGLYEHQTPLPAHSTRVARGAPTSGKATADDGSLRRPEYFSVGDIACFEKHEEALSAAAAIAASDERAFSAAVESLPEAARSLMSVPVFPADMARNHRLHVLKVLHERQTTIADNIILKGTVLSNDRETEEQRAEDREGVFNGNLITNQ